jgi:class 3 adenylate cyclase
MATADSNDAANLAVLFADVSGSTRLYETVGDALALATIGQCLGLVGAACEGNGGRVVKTTGDEVMAVFPRPIGAAGAAGNAGGDLRARAGRRRPAHHSGHFTSGDDRSRRRRPGDSVNVAARMTALAKGQQVILSAETAAALSPLLRARVREIDLLTVKGKQQDIGIFELIWQSSEADLTSLSTRPMRRREARIRLRHGAREIELGEVRSSVTLGDQQKRRGDRRQDGVDCTPASAPARQIRPHRPEQQRDLRQDRRRAEIQLRREEMIPRTRAGLFSAMRTAAKEKKSDLFLRD